MNEQVKAYSRYVNPILSRIGYLLFVPLLVPFIGHSLINGLGDRVAMGLFGLLVCISVPLKGWKDYKDYLNCLEEEGTLSEIVADFSGAKSYLKGSLMLGEKFVHLKSGTSIPYTDICRAFPHVRKFLGANGVPVLIFEDFEEKIIGSVTLPKRGQDREGTRDVLQRLKEINPDILLEAV